LKYRLIGSTLIYISAFLLGLGITLFLNKSYYAALLLGAPLTAIILRVTRDKGLAFKFFAILTTSSIMSSPIVSFYVPAHIISSFIEGKISESPLALEILSNLKLEEALSAPSLIVITMWSAAVLSQFMLTYAVYLMLRNFWASIERLPNPYFRACNTASLSFYTGKIGSLVAALAGIGTGLGTAFLSANHLLIFFSISLLSTLSFIATFILGLGASQLVNYNFTLGAYTGLLIYILAFAAISRRQYITYDINLPAPATLLLLSVLAATPLLFFLAALNAAFLLGIYIVISVLTAIVMLRFEGEYSLLALVELTVITQSKWNCLYLSGGVYEVIPNKAISSVVVFSVSTLLVYINTLLVASALREVSKVRRFEGVAPLAVAAFLSTFLSALYYFRVRPGEVAAFSLPLKCELSILNLDVRMFLLGLGVTLLFSFIYIIGGGVPLNPAGFVLGVTVGVLYPLQHFQVIAVLALSIVLKYILVGALRIETGKTAEIFSMFIWGSIMGIALNKLISS